MDIYPAIDILGGKAVRLTRGDYATGEVFSDDPVKVLQGFRKQGAQFLHVVDLDGAKDGSIANFAIIRRLAAEGGVFMEVGGGIRNEERVRSYLELGVGRVILGTAAVRDFSFAEKMAARYPGRIAVGVDAKDGFVAVDGWKTVTDTDAYLFCARCAEAGIDKVIFTDIATDGGMAGTNMEAFRKLSQIKGLDVIASGGISDETELRALRVLSVSGAILGKAIYKGLIDLSRAVQIGRGEL
jgi:phosphoribosylformimino-5-aminoimidazole carboxamide ribotide isomerase